MKCSSPNGLDDKLFNGGGSGTEAGAIGERNNEKEPAADFGAPMEKNTYDNVRKMILQLSIIGATTLENSGIPINERYVY
ncbi:hypothetical protein FG386_001958 [Cryptosporidium ryanae]|uniref:uncharacterized protein n=1 Tax=Cryptosporidium ryanae TaxID=515981 RepID=UPI00351A98B8|nr:hypothetical protein FG386_001958 [Cryptosporidium ryanae]